MQDTANQTYNDNESVTLTDDTLSLASQGQLVWWKFTQHKLAVFSGVFLILLYSVAIFADFFSPYVPTARHSNYQFSPPQVVRFIDGEEGFRLRAFVYGLNQSLDMHTMTRVYEVDKSIKHSIYFFVRREPYKLLGLFETDRRLFGVEDGGTLFLFGTDRQSRDLFSRSIHAARISLSIGLVGVTLSFFLGITLGGIAGLFGGIVDNAIQRLSEILRAFPTIPLWMALSAALPIEWSTMAIYFSITIILSLTGWTDLARQVRGKFLSLRQEDFVLAARLSGASTTRIISVHLVPSLISHIIAVLSLSVPTMIIAETSLSFLGLGLRAPAISWGVLLQQAQSVHTLAFAPWLMIPGLLVIVTVLAFNFLGDGLRDAADPYSSLR